MVLENFAELLAMITVVSGSIMSFSFFIQSHKIWRRKSAEDISLPFFIIFLIGTILWLLYGLSINSYSVTIANTFAVIGISSVIALYLKYKKK